MGELVDVKIDAILIVDDSSSSAEALSGMLAGQGYTVWVVADGAQALREIELHAPDLIVFDIGQPDADGFAICQSLKATPRNAEIPIVYVSAANDTASKVAAFELGCVDYLTKPYAFDEMLVRIQFHLKQKHVYDLLGFRAGHDALTGLPNRNLLIDRLQQAVKHAERYERRVAVAYIDLDKFKFINDSLGHEVGDQVLVEVARRLPLCVRDSDTVARLGGDEFVVVLYDQANEDITVNAMQRILHSIAEPIVVNGSEIRTTCSIGFSFFPQDGLDVETLLKNADAAMYRAKELGRNNFQFFTDELTAHINERVALEQSLRGALERGEFVLHYQPKVDLRSGKVVGLEALLRWNHPTLGMVAPLRFIPLAEEIGLMQQIGLWAMRAACRQQKEWQQGKVADLPIAVNISSLQFLQNDFTDLVTTVLQETGVSPQSLELEISETLSMQDPHSTIRVLTALRNLGVRLVVDDFGTGYTNLSFLKQFPLDTIKLHQSFVRDIERNPEDLAISDAVISMAHSLHLRVTAEGVESGSQLALLADRGCDEMQGNYFSAAVSDEQCAELLLEQRSLPMDRLGRKHTVRTLLLVDDEAKVLSAIERSLNAQACRILRARSAVDAFDLLATNEVGVIVCDQRMPKMTGIEFLSRIRRMYPRTVRIILSGHADVGVVADAINLGAVYKFLNKPWEQAELCKIIEEAFAKYENDRLMEIASIG
ncbi:MAG: EAL domain-containing protein [Burkholderiaceae bacterium]|nr:EAL domain-containing protein [Burkholderiaceae bacterium]